MPFYAQICSGESVFRHVNLTVNRENSLKEKGCTGHGNAGERLGAGSGQ